LENIDGDSIVAIGYVTSLHLYINIILFTYLLTYLHEQFKSDNKLEMFSLQQKMSRSNNGLVSLFLLLSVW